MKKAFNDAIIHGTILNQDDKDSLAGRIQQMNDAVGSNLRKSFMRQLALRNDKLPAAGKPKTEMGLLNGELNLLMKNLGIEEEEKEAKPKGEGGGGDAAPLFSLSPPKAGELTADNSEFYNTKDGFNRDFNDARSSAEPLKKTENYSG